MEVISQHVATVLCVEPFRQGGDLLAYVLRDEPFGHGVYFSTCVLSGAHEGKERTTYIVYNGNIET